jgi:hypothetical protein
VFRDAELRELAIERFVCAADEVWRLQRGSDEDCVFFQRAVNGGERITDAGTRQGTWVFAPSGALLGHLNSRAPHDVKTVLTQALARFEALPQETRHLSADAALDPGHRWEDSFPEDGLVLLRTARDLPAEGLESARPATWNRDFAWFTRGEVAAMTAGLEPGMRRELPLLAQRLARFHLVDNVRGQTIPYAPAEIRRAELVATVTARVGETLVLALEGATVAVAEGPWLLGKNLWRPTTEHAHGIDCTLRGRALLDRASGRLSEFVLVGLARRFGRTENNARWREPAPSRIAFHLTLAAAAPRVAPTFVALYDADWIVLPEVGTWNRSPDECGLERR